MTLSIAGRRILLVEDEYFVALLAKEALLEAGATVVGPVANCRNALEALRTTAIDAALLDVNLNGERSDPVAAELRDRKIPFLVVTGYGMNAATEALGGRILDKPFRPEALIRALRETLAGEA